jgi:hypothetical protein
MLRGMVAGPDMLNEHEAKRIDVSEFAVSAIRPASPASAPLGRIVLDSGR